MPVGDVTSKARGSGARYNDGKPDLALIPVDAIAASYGFDDPVVYSGDVAYVLGMLGKFQTTGDPYFLGVALTRMRRHWRDCARVFEYGRTKYAAWNWAKGMAWSIPIACAARHALAILEGDNTDRESGLPHVGHLLCNLVMLRHFVEHYPEGNDLPPADLFCAEPIPGMDQPNMGIRDTGDSTPELKSRNSTAGFTQPPNCSPGVSEPTPPMHAVALEIAEASIAGRTQPGEVGN